ncbi:MAG: hypothetical protein QXU81_10545 [Candidatus Bathyarchaeia archaeon]
MAKFELRIVSLFIIMLLVAVNIYMYHTMSTENNRLRLMLREKEDLCEELYSQLKPLEEEVRMLNESYHKVLEANGKLEEALKYLQGKLVLPYNFTFVTPSEFAERYHFAYSDEMVEFVMNATGGWDGSEEDFLSDLYKIYVSWSSVFIYDENPPPVAVYLPYINIGGWNYYKTEIGDEYLAEVLFYEDNPIKVPVWSVVLDFNRRRGVCTNYAVVLVALYYAYSDTVGRKLPAAYLSMEMEDGARHGCVLLKGEGDSVAIVDWEPITAENGMIKFMPLDEARQLHSRYWWNRELNYDGIWMRPNTSRFFNSHEEFRLWLMEEF